MYPVRKYDRAAGIENRPCRSDVDDLSLDGGVQCRENPAPLAGLSSDVHRFHEMYITTGVVGD